MHSAQASDTAAILAAAEDERVLAEASDALAYASTDCMRDGMTQMVPPVAAAVGK